MGWRRSFSFLHMLGPSLGCIEGGPNLPGGGKSTARSNQPSCGPHTLTLPEAREYNSDSQIRLEASCAALFLDPKTGLRASSTLRSCFSIRHQSLARSSFRRISGGEWFSEHSLGWRHMGVERRELDAARLYRAPARRWPRRTTATATGLYCSAASPPMGHRAKRGSRTGTGLKKGLANWPRQARILHADGALPRYPKRCYAIRRAAAASKTPAQQNSYFNDTWDWDGQNWTQQEDTGPNRCAHALAYDDARQRLVLFGGGDANAQQYGDTWEWDGTTWTQRTDFGPPPTAGAKLIYTGAECMLLGERLTTACRIKAEPGTAQFGQLVRTWDPARARLTAWLLTALASGSRCSLAVRPPGRRCG